MAEVDMDFNDAENNILDSKDAENDVLDSKDAENDVLDSKDAENNEIKVNENVLMPERKSKIKNAIRRRIHNRKEKAEKKKEKKARKKSLKDDDYDDDDDEEEKVKKVPHTIESLRVPDESTVNLSEEKVLEMEKEDEHDELSSYFSKDVEPKVLITYSDNPHKKTRIFGVELTRIIPNSIARYRNRSGVKKIVKSALREGFTDVIVINENQKQPNGLLLIHLPNGPTALFRLSNVRITPELKKNYKKISEARPEVVLNNFTTRLGVTVSRMLAALFHYDPEFQGRRAVTFHNQRDFIFFRHHKYKFENSKRVNLRELGPRFTLKLRSLQNGTFDSKAGDYEWISEGRRHTIEANRRKFVL